MVVLVFLLAPAGSAFWPVVPSPAAQDECRLVRKNRHRPKVCSKGGCEKCPEPACAKANCGRKRG